MRNWAARCLPCRPALPVRCFALIEQDIGELEKLQASSAERVTQMEIENTKQCNMLQQRIGELEEELDDERSRHRIDVQELEGMQEEMLKELAERENEVKKFEGQQCSEGMRPDEDRTAKFGTVEQRVTELEEELDDERSRHRIEVQELEGMQEAMLKELEDKERSIRLLQAEVQVKIPATNDANAAR